MVRAVRLVADIFARILAWAKRRLADTPQFLTSTNDRSLS
jgi:hypothetical protein